MLDQLRHDYAALAERVRLLETAMSPLESLQADYVALASRVDALESQPPPPPPPAGRITASRFRLIGGWRLANPFPKNGFAIDFAGSKVFSGGHAQKNEIIEYDLATMGTGESLLSWPILRQVAVHGVFWPAGSGYAGGLLCDDRLLWVCPRVYYDTAPKSLIIAAKNLATGEVQTLPTTLPRPGYGGGFVKGRGDMLVGCGGYESGQGSVSGPTCATLDGVELLRQANHGTLDWDARTPREPNYEVAKDSWVGLNPRNGEGRWASDLVRGGGIWLQDGLCYWPTMGTGLLSYSYQSPAFGRTWQTYLYTYDPHSFDDVRYERWTHGEVIGSEIGPDGLVYLMINNAWKSASYVVDPVIKVFEVI